jgi:hypothetical protein
VGIAWWRDEPWLRGANAAKGPKKSDCFTFRFGPVCKGRRSRILEINMLFKRVMPLLALAAGSLGLVACIAGAYPISLVKTRLDRTNERVFVTRRPRSPPHAREEPEIPR